jgi:hypothetical protein
MVLLPNQRTPIQTITNHANSQNHLSHRQFITNHLSHRTTTSQKGIFTITGPPCLQNSVHTKASNSQNIHSSLIQIPDSPCLTGRQSSPPKLTSLESQNRSPQEQAMICTARNHRFFQLQFQAVQEGLKHTKQSPSIRSLSSLHCTHNSTFYQSQESYSKLLRYHSRLNHHKLIKNHMTLEENPHHHLIFFTELNIKRFITGKDFFCALKIKEISRKRQKAELNCYLKFCKLASSPLDHLALGEKIDTFNYSACAFAL